MTNREKYITKRNEYDMMIAIQDRLDKQEDHCGWCEVHRIGCSIELISGSRPNREDCMYATYDRCDSCIQRWLNEKNE